MILDQSEQARLEDKFIGCLLGGAVGDALGFTTENMSRKRIQAKFSRLTDYKVKPSWAYYTDDTQLTIALAETLVANNGYDNAHFRRKLARLVVGVPTPEWTQHQKCRHEMFVGDA